MILRYNICKAFQGKDGQWYFNIKGENGHIVLQSEGYTTKSNAN